MATNPIDALSVRVRRSGKRAALMAELQRDEIVARIKQAREQAGMSQTEMGDFLNVHWRTVQNYETIRVPYALLGRIAEVTGKTSEWLLHGDTPDVLGALNGDGPLTEILELLRRLDERLTQAEQAQSNAAAQQMQRAAAILQRFDDIEASIQELAARRRRTA